MFSAGLGQGGGTTNELLDKPCVGGLFLDRRRAVE
jgi:hypothetical protein